MARMEGVIADKRTDKQGDRVSFPHSVGRIRVTRISIWRCVLQFCLYIILEMFFVLNLKRDVEYSVAFHGS